MSEEKTDEKTESKDVDLIARYNDLVQKKIPWVKVKALPFGMGDLIKEIVEYVGVIVMRMRTLEKRLAALEEKSTK